MKRFAVVAPLYAALCLLLLSLATPSLSTAQIAKNRIAQAIDNADVVALKGSRHGLAREEFDQGRVDGAMKLTGVTINFRPSAAQQAALNKLLEEQQTPGSANYHKWITPEQYAARFGMSQADLNKVTAWLTSQGFTGIAVERNHNTISFNGTAAQIQNALRTELHHYQVGGEMHFAMAEEPSLPRAFADAVLSVGNLSDFRPKPRVKKVNTSDLDASAHFTSSVSGNHFLSPADFATIYNVQPLYDAGLDGSGVTIAVVGQTAISTTDTRAFRSAAGLAAKDPVMTLVPNTGTSVHVADDEVEADLDVEWSGGVAKGATVNYMYAGNATNKSVWDALAYAVGHPELATVVTTSYGFCEAGLPASFPTQVQGLIQQGASMGQTVTASSGDDGAADCEVPVGNNPITSGTQGPAVDVPASIPEVTGLGGTEFSADCATGSCAANGSNAPYWAGTSGSDVLSSALEYIPETTWNDTTFDLAHGGGLSATGGGASTIFLKPSWQTGTGVPAANHRYVPDIALSASADHDPYLVCSTTSAQQQTPADTSCPTSGSFRTGAGNLLAVGGTSVSSQVFGGILAILNQAMGAGLGPVNSTLYSLKATHAAAFHDITTGSNIVPCTQGTTGCPASAPFQYGFSATAGYDEVTGLGTIDANVLVNAWPGFTPTPNFSLSGPAITIASAGASGTSTITLAPSNGFTGTVDLTCALTPASTTAEITCTVDPSVAITSGSATATLTVATTAAHARTSTSASARPRGCFPWLAASSGLGFAGIVLLGIPSRRRKSAALAMVMFACLTVWAGCGGGASSNSNNTPANPGTPANTYTIAVTGTSGSISHTTNVTVTVQ